MEEDQQGFATLFIVVWLGGLAFFHFSGKYYDEGSRVPTATHSEPFDDHGAVRYVTVAQKQLVDQLQLFSMAGVPAIFALGALLHFIVGVKLFPAQSKKP